MPPELTRSVEHEVTLEFHVVCRVCSRDLDVHVTNRGSMPFEVEVEVCPTCLDEAQTRARKEATEDA